MFYIFILLYQVSFSFHEKTKMIELFQVVDNFIVRQFASL
jgi:hypothetical protein